jgi:hypothetical protein
MSSILDDADPFGQTWKTGQRVPITGNYRDQYGTVSTHEAHRTFPPCIGRKGECAHRTLIRPA